MIEPYVAIMGFNEIHALKRLIPNLKSIGVPDDRIIFFDGPFEDFKSDKTYSTDGTLEYLQENNIKVVACGRMKHMEKQTYRFKYFKDSESLLILDCDEYLTGDWNEFCKTFELVRSKYNFPVYKIISTDMDMYYTHVTERPRLFTDPQNWEVRDRHWFFYYKGQRQDYKISQIIGSLHSFHDSSIRPSWREEQMKNFQNIYTEKEQKEHLTSIDLYLPKDRVQCNPCGCTFGYVYYYGEKNGKVQKLARSIDVHCKKHHEQKKMVCEKCHGTSIKCVRCNYQI